ncbi:uncharacterized protein LOC123202391 [Mangifera indica]|uniref:uncharacterized protein LOC123202391 n=1 Tax=Mangifera indica TaxID=29780 RepID=UPI001CFB72E4|nr:uncharacterized protein LOC123202391 [Mangifera indica]
MAYRRRHGITKSSTFKEEIYHPPDNNNINSNGENIIKASLPTLKTSYSFSPSSATQSLAAQVSPASAAHRDSSPSSAHPLFPSETQEPKSFTAHEDVSARDDSKGFWGVLARKAKSILEDEELSPQSGSPAKSRWQMSETSAGVQSQQPFQSSAGTGNWDNPRLQGGLDRIASSLNQTGDTFEKPSEEGRTIAENKTADVTQETGKLHIRQKGSTNEEQNRAPAANSTWQPVMQTTQSQNQTSQETKLKASRDVAMATAAKAKLLLREIKTVKADLAFAKQRCTQLEDENKLLRESRERGQNPADDDLVRLQLETLLAEKARLANENSIYDRENQFLREIVEYHQLTEQDIVYLDEGSEEVTEVYPNVFSDSQLEELTEEIFPVLSEGRDETSQNDVPTNLLPSTTEVPEENGAKKPSKSSV